MHAIRFDDVTKSWPESPYAVDHVLLSIDAGEFFSIVGPSGCGKTTLLRILCGLEAPTSGYVVHGGVDITRWPTRERGFGLVTQQNQLPNHLTAEKNIGFPLEVRRSSRASVPDTIPIPDRVRHEAEAFGIADLLARRPATLSEGQRRLVQLAREVIAGPSTLLLDEPLGYLEDQSRTRVRNAILHTHADRGLTTLMVTANQLDAMVMSDRIAVMFDGAVEQVGSPQDVYDRPATVRVATFFGEPAMNVWPTMVRRLEGGVAGGGVGVEVLGRVIELDRTGIEPYVERPVLVGIRPDEVSLRGNRDSTPGVAVTVGPSETVGHATFVRATTGDGASVRSSVTGPPPRAGSVVTATPRSARIHLFDPATGIAVHHPASLR